MKKREHFHNRGRKNTVYTNKKNSGRGIVENSFRSNCFFNYLCVWMKKTWPEKIGGIFVSQSVRIFLYLIWVFSISSLGYAPLTVRYLRNERTVARIYPAEQSGWTHHSEQRMLLSRLIKPLLRSTIKTCSSSSCSSSSQGYLHIIGTTFQPSLMLPFHFIQTIKRVHRIESPLPAPFHTC
jgi:hypothetical protein